MKTSPTRPEHKTSFTLRVRLLSTGLLLSVGMLASVNQLRASDERLAPEDAPVSSITTPDWEEPVPPKSNAGPEPTIAAAGAIAPATRQPSGVLSGRIVFMNSGHGWTFDPTYWRLQRPSPLLDMNEDYGNLDQLNFFATYCFNAGAVVVSMRPLGHQTNEVVLDNDDPGVTFSGAWSDSTSPIFFGSPGDLPYRYASFSSVETATATYTPNIPVTGYYPVYTWARHGSDRGDQLYRIRHTGGESLLRIPHYMVGNGWIYLGEYYFTAGSNPAVGSVVISNLRETGTGSVVIADAIRFGNGMGTVDRGGGVSGYPREDENMRYWIQANLAQGQSTSLYNGSGDDESDSWSAPPKMSAEMNREESDPGDIHKRIHISFHSNAGGGRGTVGLITGDPTPHQSRLAEIAGREVNDDLVDLGSPPLEVPWYDRSNVTYSGGYSEIDGSFFNYEMAATIIEVAYHDSTDDTKLLRDPKARAAVGKAAMHAVVKYMHEFDTNNPVPLNFLPEPPTRVRAHGGEGGLITLNWVAPVNVGGSQSPTNYIVYRSTNGHGFGNPVFVGNVTSHTFSNLTADVDYYFRVSASNAGGESMPSEVVGCRTSVTNPPTRILIVNGFDRFDRTGNLRQDTQSQNYDRPGPTGGIERVFPRWNNAFDYVVQHGKALASSGMCFDSCQNESITSGQVSLNTYDIVIWACGNESTADETFSAAEQSFLGAFLNGSGNLFVSGSDIAWDLDRASGPTTPDRTFLNSKQHVDLGADANDNAASHSFSATSGGIFTGNPGGTFDDGNAGIYWVSSPDKLTPVGPGASASLNYVGGLGGAAAVQYDGSAGGGRVVVFGFPFETIVSEAVRNAFMSDIMDFLGTPTTPSNAPPAFVVQPRDQIVQAGTEAMFNALTSSSGPVGYQWQFNNVDIPGAMDSTLSIPNARDEYAGAYRVIATNSFGASTSQVAALIIALPYPVAFADDFDSNSASSWATNNSGPDTRVTFNYDYSADGIEPAPDTTNGTTRGIKFEANLTGGLAAAINVSPVGQSFSGNYRLRFDMWINANGPFPFGGTGSTEHFTAGVGTDGGRTQWTGTGTTADGVWFAVDGEGQSSDTTTTSLPDFAALNGTALQSSSSGAYAAGTSSDSRGNGNAYYQSTFPGGRTAPASQTSTYPQQTGSLSGGTVGLAWRRVLIEKIGNNVDWYIDGLRIASFHGVDPSGNIFLGYWDSFNSVSDNSALSFGLADNVTVELIETNYPPLITMQPQGRVLNKGDDVTFLVSASAAPAAGYQWRFNGANINGANSTSLGIGNAQPFSAGDYTVVVSNAFGSVTSAIATLTIIQPVQLTATGTTEGAFQFELGAQPGVEYSIEGSTNLFAWEVLATFVATNTPVLWTDPDGTNHPLRFYRAGAAAP